jgi:tetratricopeptide (TPR) repeat protein
MRKHLAHVALLAALFGAGAGSANAQCNEACKPLLDEGASLYGQGKQREAWDTFQRAHQADKDASIPLSWMANMLVKRADISPPDKAPELRRHAEALAREALRLNDRDPFAQEILRDLTDQRPAPLHTPSPDAAQAVQEGEALFVQKRYPEALAKYELASARDPLFSGPWVYAGDCFFAQKQWHEAELRFRKATEIEPLNGQAWRFLSDALILQGDRRAAETALYGGIAAQPSQVPNWDKLEQLMMQEGLRLKRVTIVRKARFTGPDKNGKPTIELLEAATAPTAEQAFWLMHAASVALAAKQEKLSPYQVELQAWQAALKMVAEQRAKGESVPTDPALIAIEKLANGGQLEPAILLLMYRESYRSEFETWKKAHPDGIRAFVVSTGFRP